MCECSQMWFWGIVCACVHNICICRGTKITRGVRKKNLRKDLYTVAFLKSLTALGSSLFFLLFGLFYLRLYQIMRHIFWRAVPPDFRSISAVSCAHFVACGNVRVAFISQMWDGQEQWCHTGMVVQLCFAYPLSLWSPL